MSGKRKSFSPSFKEAAVRAVIEDSRAVAEVARELHVVEQTLRNWVNAYRVEHAGDEPPLTLTERAELVDLRKEVRELRLRTEFLGKAAAFFAQEYR